MKKYINKNRQPNEKKILCILLIALINLFRLPEMNTIRNGFDDFGYISIAAFISNKFEWNGLMSHSAYYSWGYPLVISGLTYLFQSPELLIKAIIVTNTFFLVLSFYFTNKLINKLYPNITENISLIIALLANIYIGYIVYVKYAFVESFLVFLYVLIIYNFYMICAEKASHIYFFLIAFLGTYIFFVHQRTICILLAISLIILFLYIHKKINVLDVIIFFSTTILFLFVGNEVKTIVKNILFISSKNENVYMNDFAGQLDVLKNLFTWHYIKYLILGFTGRFFYFGLATFSIGFIGIISSLKKALNIFRDHRNYDGYFYSFITLSFLLTCAIVTIFFLEPTRYDTPLYGRYIEYHFVIFIVEGLITIIDKRLFVKDLIIMLCLSLISYLSIFIIYLEKNLQPTGSDMIPAMFSINIYCVENNLDYSSALKMSLGTLISSCIMVYAISLFFNKKNKVFLATILIILFWVPSYLQLEKRCVNAHEGIIKKYHEISDTQIKRLDKLFCILSDSLTLQDINRIQFMCPDTAISIINLDSISEEAPNSIMTDINFDLTIYGYKSIYQNEYALIWVRS